MTTPRTAPDRHSALRGTLLLLALGWLGWIGFRQLRPPAAVPADAPPIRFAAERAFESLQRIAAVPHPLGSDAALHLHDWLIARLDSLGYQVATQDTVGFLAVDGWPRAGRVRNIIARRRGADSGRAVLLMAHYDAVPRSFGAGDDGVGVAAILEIARARQHDSLRNDLMILLSDGEEAMLLGAEAFFDLHPWAREVGAVINMDNRGTGGAALMFQTSPRNGALIAQLPDHPSAARANAVMNDLYRLLPNDTDLSVAIDRGYAGINLALIEGYPRYHSPEDDLAHLDLRSVQQEGETALLLSRRLSRLDLRQAPEPDQVYFNLPFLGLIHYPARQSPIWAGGVLLLTLLLLVIAVRRHQATPSRLLGGLGVLLVLLALAGAIGELGWRILDLFDTQHRALTWGEPYFGRSWLVAWGAMVVVASVGILRLAGRRLTPVELALPPLLLWSIAGVVLAFALPGASSLFIWPALAGILGAWLSTATRAATLRTIALALLAAPVLWLWVPMLFLLETGLTIRGLFLFMALLAAVLTFLIPVILAIGTPWKVVAPVLALGGIAGVLLHLITPPFSPTSPRQDSLMRVVNADRAQGRWVSLDRVADEWTDLAIGSGVKPAQMPGGAWHHTPVAARSGTVTPDSTTPPSFTLLSFDTLGTGRRLRFRVGETTRPVVLEIRLTDSAAAMHDLTIDGRAIPPGTPGDTRYAAVYRHAAEAPLLTLFGVPPEGIEIAFTVESSAPIAVKLREVRDGLPGLDGVPFPPRPPGIIAAPTIWTDVTVISRTIHLD